MSMMSQLKTQASKLFVLVILIGLAAPRTSTALDIQLYDFLDTFGEQVAALQAVDTGAGLEYAVGIYDTGASVSTISQGDQSFMNLPVKCAGCAEAQAIGGSLVGDVGQPQTFFVDGLHNITFNLNDLFDLNSGYAFVNPGDALTVPGVQPFIGTGGSAALPSIAGTPSHIAGKAARIDMRGSVFDMGTVLEELFTDLGFPGLDLTGFVITQPDLHFVNPNTSLDAPSGTITGTYRVQLTNFGVDNTANPGNEPSVLPNPLIPGITAADDGNLVTDLNSKTLLFDTGAQLSVISTEFAMELGLDLSTPEFVNPVQGAAGTPVTLNGYYLDELIIPVEGGDELVFMDAPVFVLDIADGIDGIIGMNLFNTANQMLYDPLDASGNPILSLTFDTDANRGLTGGLEGLVDSLGGDIEATFGDPTSEEYALLAALFGSLNSVLPAFGGSLGVSTPQLPGFDLQNAPGGSNAAAVPEPSSALLCLMLVGGLIVRRRRQSR